jgi:hypothetical protein
MTDRTFRDSLKDFRQVPPERVWKGIADTLEGDRRKARVAWIGRIAASVALILAAGSVWFLLHRTPDREVVKSEVEEAPAAIPGQSGTEAGMAQGGGPETERVSGTGNRAELKTPDRPEPQTGRDLEARYGAETGGGPGYSPETRPSEEMIAVENVLSGGESGGTGFAAGSVPLQPISSRHPDRLVAYTPGTGYALAVHARTEALPLREKGIDVFEEFGEEGHPVYDKWSVGGQVSPLYSYRNLGEVPEAASSRGVYNDVESGVFSYAGGVNLNYFPAKRLSIQSGIYYSRMGISISDAYMASIDNRTYNQSFPPAQLAVSNSSGQIELGPDKTNSIIASIGGKNEQFTDTWNNVPSGTPTVQDIRTGDVLQHFEYLEVPVILRYRVVDRKMGLNLLGGLSTNFLVGSNVYFEEGGSREFIGNTENLRIVNYSSVLGLGLQYSIMRNFCINLEPTFRYYLNSINSFSGIGSHPYSVGFFTGISYSF